MLTSDMEKTKKDEVQDNDWLGWGSHCCSSGVGEGHSEKMTPELRREG